MAILKIRDSDGKVQEILAIKGDNGKDGDSVTISSVVESTEDGGENVVTFSDGKTLTVRNGKTGSGGSGDGGSYVLTEADKEEIANLTLDLIVNGEEVLY